MPKATQSLIEPLRLNSGGEKTNEWHIMNESFNNSGFTACNDRRTAWETEKCGKLAKRKKITVNNNAVVKKSVTSSSRARVGGIVGCDNVCDDVAGGDAAPWEEDEGSTHSNDLAFEDEMATTSNGVSFVDGLVNHIDLNDVNGALRFDEDLSLRKSSDVSGSLDYGGIASTESARDF